MRIHLLSFKTYHGLLQFPTRFFPSFALEAALLQGLVAGPDSSIEGG